MQILIYFKIKCLKKQENLSANIRDNKNTLFLKTLSIKKLKNLFYLKQFNHRSIPILISYRILYYIVKIQKQRFNLAKNESCKEQTVHH